MTTANPTFRPAWFVRGDIDGFFGLFVDNLLQLLLITTLCNFFCGFSPQFTAHTVLPGAAVSILIGNVFYAWQSVQLMKKTGRQDVTSLPFGINTPSVIAFIFLVMAPAYNQAKHDGLSEAAAGDIAWKVGLFACLLSGVIEVVGAFVGDWLRRNTPRAALLAALAGVAITFISMGFIFQMFSYPLITVIPLVIMLVAYAGKTKFPLALPGGLISVLVGVAIAWILIGIKHGFPSLSWSTWNPPGDPVSLGFHFPLPAIGAMFSFIGDAKAWVYLTVIFPMGLFNVIGSLQNLESAEAAGDRFETRPSLLANGIGTIAAAAFGSPFPTTIYIGHPGWKSMGARAGYSILNGVAITLLCLFGGVGLILHFVPIEAMLPILLWIGIIITSQAFQDVPQRHTLAVAIGLIPSIAAWGREIVVQACLPPGTYLEAAKTLPTHGFYLDGVLALEQGFIITSIILSATLAYIIDKQFHKAAGWLFAGSILSFVGLIHAYSLTPFGPEPRFIHFSPFEFAATEFGIAYAGAGAMLLGLHWLGKSQSGATYLAQVPPQPASEVDSSRRSN